MSSLVWSVPKHRSASSLSCCRLSGFGSVSYTTTPVCLDPWATTQWLLPRNRACVEGGPECRVCHVVLALVVSSCVGRSFFWYAGSSRPFMPRCDALMASKTLQKSSPVIFRPASIRFAVSRWPLKGFESGSWSVIVCCSLVFDFVLCSTRSRSLRCAGVVVLCFLFPSRPLVGVGESGISSFPLRARRLTGSSLRGRSVSISDTPASRAKETHV